MASDSITRSSIDEILGPRERRYFGEGFRRVEHRVTELTVQHDGGGGTVEGRASLVYPADWSRKGTMDLRPHLSTIDTVIVATNLIDVYLTRAFGLAPDARAGAWLRGFTMRAGVAPHENLNDFAVTAAFAPPRADPDALGGYVTDVTCSVGAIRIRCEVEHGAITPAAGVQTFADLAEALDGDERDDPRWRRHHVISDVTADPGGRVTALVAVREPHGDAGPEGLGHRYEPALSAVDCLVCLAQLAQVAMYDLDHVDRRSSETLWMRSVWLKSRTPFQPMTNPFVASLEVSTSKLLRYAGGVWRMAEVAGTFQGIRIGSSLAHRLPELVEASGGAV